MDIEGTETKEQQELHEFIIPEVEAYLHLLVVSLLVKEKLMEDVTI